MTGAGCLLIFEEMVTSAETSSEKGYIIININTYVCIWTRKSILINTRKNFVSAYGDFVGSGFKK